MKFIGKLTALVVKLAVLAAGIVVIAEALDLLRERSQARYLVDEDFED
jgi:hypothetical protein